MPSESLERKSELPLEDIYSVLEQAWKIAHIFGKRVEDADSWPTYQQYDKNGLAIEVLHCTDFCGATNGHLSIKKEGREIFNFNYGDSALASQNRGLSGYRVDKNYLLRTGIKVNTLNQATKQELSLLYDLSVVAEANVTQRERERVAHNEHIDKLLGRSVA